MAYNSMSLHPNHMIKGLSCRQEARLQIISLLLSMVLTYTCAIFKTTKNHKTLHQFCGSLYTLAALLTVYGEGVGKGCMGKGWGGGGGGGGRGGGGGGWEGGVWGRGGWERGVGGRGVWERGVWER